MAIRGSEDGQRLWCQILALRLADALDRRFIFTAEIAEIAERCRRTAALRYKLRPDFQFEIL
jgi:hypothetical protein